MKQIITFLGLFLSIQFLSAQEEKLRVAVFDPTSASVSIDGGTKEAVRELISSTFVNTGKYIMVERSMLQQVMKELKMNNTDAFDDSQATELGKLAGANKVVLSVVSMVGGRNMLSIKIIDVQTATIDQQKTKIVGTNDLLDAVEPLTSELIGVPVTSSQKSGGVGGIVSGLLGGKGDSKSDADKALKQQQKALEQQQKLLEQQQKQLEQMANTVAPTVQQISAGGNISLSFAGFKHKNNPGANIYVNGNLIGRGTLNQGFSVSFSENHVGDYTVRVEWESVVSTKEFTINTSFKKQFVFEYVKGGFGYEFRLKN